MPHNQLLINNRNWAREMKLSNPKFFDDLSGIQNPKFLWIGCADSRVPSNQITGVLPGQIFTHRNVANVVVHTDLNCLSVIQYAVDVLKVEHIIVCGHYGCGGVRATLEGAKLGLIDNWLRHIRDVQHKHAVTLAGYPGPEQLDALCELNVIEQANNVCQTSIVQEAWSRGQQVSVHAWVYGLTDGLINDLGFHAGKLEDLTPAYGAAIGRVRARGIAPRK
jgi:carbonic anhydrase